MEEMNKEDGDMSRKKDKKMERVRRKKGRQRAAPVNEERQKQGHLFPASVLTLSTLVPY